VRLGKVSELTKFRESLSVDSGNEEHGEFFIRLG
jgi:hypothetical protein